jgi:L-asparaginase
MTFEAAVTKMMYLLGQLDDPKEVKRLLEVDLRGELTVS